MDIPESNEVRQHRSSETHRDNVLSYWLFLPAIAAMIIVMVIAFTRSGGHLLPFVASSVFICMVIGAAYRQGWRGIVALIMFLGFALGMMIGLIKGLEALL